VSDTEKSPTVALSAWYINTRSKLQCFAVILSGILVAFLYNAVTV